MKRWLTVHRVGVTRAARLAEPGMRVLDAGCGAGTDLAVLAALVGPDGHVLGIDKSETMVAEARQRSELAGLAVELQQGDVYQLAWPEASFDACHTRLRETATRSSQSQ